MQPEPRDVLLTPKRRWFLMTVLAFVAAAAIAVVLFDLTQASRRTAYEVALTLIVAVGAVAGLAVLLTAAGQPPGDRRHP